MTIAHRCRPSIRAQKMGATRGDRNASCVFPLQATNLRTPSTPSSRPLLAAYRGVLRGATHA